MIPRVARSGQSFQGAGQYYLNDKLSDRANDAFAAAGGYALHDKGSRQTADRVGFTAILNMEAATPEQAIEQMSARFERYREMEAHKRGRKLTKPVYVYSLAWAPDQTPNKEEMLAAAHSSLEALRLTGLQTLIVQHTDEPQPHIHILVNRIECDGSRARNIPFDKLRFSQWAEQYERDHGGIRCEQRVENNELRRQGIHAKDNVSLGRFEYERRERAQRAEVQKWRGQHDDLLKAAHGAQKSQLWQKQTQERLALETRTRERISLERPIVKARFNPEWAKVYRRQDERQRELQFAKRSGIFERATFLYRHFGLLKSAGKMRMRDVVRMALSGRALEKRLEQAHRMERGVIARWEKRLEEGAIKIAWREHNQDFQIMRARQQLERDMQGSFQKNELTNIARDRDIADRQTQSAPAHEPSRPIEQEQPIPKRSAPQLSEGSQIAPQEAKNLLAESPALVNIFKDKAQLTGEAHVKDVEKRMKNYKRRNPGKDFGHDL